MTRLPAVTLDVAVRQGDLATATDLLRAGERVDHRDPEGMTALMIAAGLGQSQMVELLLTAGADVHAIEPRMGAAALHKAAQSGNADVIGQLLDHAAFIDQQSPVLGNTPLVDAVLHAREGAVHVLLDRSARTRIRNHWNQTALELARADSLHTIVRWIEAREAADAERVGALALIAAVKAGNRDELERLVATGVDLDERVPVTGDLDDDYTPMGIAAREGRADLVGLLIEAGADPRRVVGLMKGTPVHEAAYFGHADVIRTLTALGEHAGAPAIELDAQGPYNGLTPLHDAIWRGHPQAARALVDAKARLDLRTHAGLTPRELALLHGRQDLARMLAAAERP